MTFYSLIKPYRNKTLLTLLIVFIANFLSLALPWGIKMIIDDVLPHRDTHLLGLILLGLTGIVIVQLGFNFFRKIFSYSIGEKIVCDVKEKIFLHIQNISLGSIKKITPPQILTRITGDAESIRRFIFNDVVECIYAVLSLGFISVILLAINLRLTLIALFSLPMFALMYFRMVPRLEEGYGFFRDASGALSSRINEVLNGMAVVRVFTAEGHEQRRFSEQQKKIFQIAKKNQALNAGLWTGIDFFTSLGVLGVLWIGGIDVLQQRMTSGELVAFYSYLGMLFSPLARLVMINGSYQEARASLNRINEIMEIHNEAPSSQTPVVFHRIKGSVEFKNITFGYTETENVLQDISFSVNPGETVGIVGPSGVGKTTLLSLLVRFFDPTKGGVFVDGHNIKDFDIQHYRQNLAVVLQDDYLFSGTIQENICYGNFGASLETMMMAARIAHADNFIQQFKDGYLTRVGDRGTQLSSGQRQRIAIARAMMRNPSILILDEATSAVDAITENRIQKSIRQHMMGKTVFIVAHRFSTIMEADKIIVLERGEIVEQADHDSLLKKQGFYSSLYLEQFKEKDKSSLLGRAVN